MPPTPGAIIRVNTAADGTQANGYSWLSFNAFSPDGTRVLFTSTASNLVPGDTNEYQDIFAKDLTTGAITRVNTAADGSQSSWHYLNNPRFFPDSTRVLFESSNWTLVPDDTNNADDLFVKDLATGAITRVNTAADGTQANAGGIVPDWNHPDISADGTRVLFLSPASNLVPGDTNGIWDLFVKDLVTGAITRVNTAADGTQAAGDDLHLAYFEFSPDASHVLFYSQAPNLVPDAAGKPADLYIKNLATGAITRSNAFGADQESAAPREYAFSADGSTVLTDIGTIKNLATGALTRTRTDTIFSSPTRSPDGTRALFWRNANTALPGDPEYGAYMLDLFVEDMATGASVRVNTAADGTPATNSGGSRYDTFSPDGTRVLFTSDATALVPGDTNDHADLFIKTFELPASVLSIAAGDAARHEGTGENTPLTFTITHSGTSGGATTIDWAVTGSGANPAVAEDFAGGVLPSGTLSFAAGQTARTLTLPVAGDTLIEPDEGFTVTLSNPGADSIIVAATAAAGGIIGNDDAASTDPIARLAIVVIDAALPEGNPDSTPSTFTFTVTRSGNTALRASVTWSLRGSGAHPADVPDFAHTASHGGTLRFGPFENTRTIAVPISGDIWAETHETFEVVLSKPSPGTAIDTAIAQATIQPDDAIVDFALFINSGGDPSPLIAWEFYQGPVAGIEKQWVHAGTHGLHVTAMDQNWFIRTGSGDDAIAVRHGTNVLDGGGGSNLLTGGYGPDTFFVDAHNPSAPSWSTISNFGFGDAATIWGIDEADFVLEWLDNLGARDFTGLTLLATAPGAPTVALTLAGYTTADLANGTLRHSFGFDPASSSTYMHLAHL